MRKLLLVLTVCTICSCKFFKKSDKVEINKYLFDQVQTGGVTVIPIETPKGKFNVWTKYNGDNYKIKVLLLNGGPGATHEYFECFENFLDPLNIEFIYYDQLGCGLSRPEPGQQCRNCVQPQHLPVRAHGFDPSSSGWS